MKHDKLSQPDMFTDPELIKPPPGGDAGMQLDMFGGTHLHETFANEATQEAADIIERHNGQVSGSKRFRVFENLFLNVNLT